MKDKLLVSSFIGEARKDKIFDRVYLECVQLTDSTYSADLRSLLLFFSWHTGNGTMYKIHESFPYEFISMSVKEVEKEWPLVSYIFKRKSDSKHFILHTQKQKIKFDHFIELKTIK